MRGRGEGRGLYIANRELEVTKLVVRRHYHGAASQRSQGVPHLLAMARGG